jgi:hypothetical protein
MEAPLSLRASRVLSGRTFACAVALVLVAAVFAASFQLNRVLAIKPGPDEYNVAGWVARNFGTKWLFEAGQVLHGRPSVEEQNATLERFFLLTREISSLERQVSDARQRGLPPDDAMVARLEAKLEERHRIANQVQATIEARISEAIRAEGLTRSVLVADVVWPPVDFTFTNSPRALAVSPRDRIQLLGSTLLRENLTLAEIERIEAEAEARDNVSALAFPTGGVGAYPAIINYVDDYKRALDIVAHEWMHNYLFFRPLGFNYYASSDLRTMNETVADLVGLELAEAVMARYPLPGEDAPAPAEPPPEATAPAAPRFDIGSALRALRGEVDVLLEAGKVEEAEALMEQRRQEFAAEGHNFRKLNQAYFAYTNLYAGEAGSPAAVNPIGPKIDELRQRTDSLSEFVDIVGGLTSVEALDRALGERR